MTIHGDAALEKIKLAASPPPWARPGSGTPTATDSSSGSAPGGFKLKMDPTLPSGSQSVVDSKGKSVGTVKKIGNKYAASWENYKVMYASAQAAVSKYAMSQKMKDKSSS